MKIIRQAEYSMKTAASLFTLLIWCITASISNAQDTSIVEYTGRYVFPAGSAVEEADVTSEAGTLTISASLGVASLTREKGDIFLIPQYSGKVEFFRDTTKKITGIKVIIPMADIDAEGKKAGTDTTTSRNTGKDVDIQAHQGGCGLWPCNTLEAFTNAVKLGVTTLELDCVISKDSLVLVSHDQFMNSTMITPEGKPVPDGLQQQYNIFKMPYDSVRKYDAGSGYDRNFPDQKKLKTYKPLLAEVFDQIEKYTTDNGLRPVNYNIEIKSLRGDNVYHPAPEVFTDLVVRIIKDKGITDRVMIQSFDVRALRHLHRRYPEIKASYLVSNKSTVQKNLERLGFEPAVFSPEFRMLTPEMVKDVRKTSMALIPWTIDTKTDMKRILSMGVDGIITNYPNIALNLKNE